MKKLYLNMVLALTVAFASFSMAGITAKAETFSPSWTVVYDGGKTITSPDYAGIDHVYEDAMPGDTIQYSVTYYNNSSEDVEFYMSADVAKTLEEGTKATGGAYSYKITSSESEEPLFKSDTVGGDADSEAEEVVGLLQVNGNKGAYFSLGEVAKNGGHGTVTVTVELDGNSQTNNYWDAVGSLEIKFGAQPVTIAHEGEKIEKHNNIVKKVIKQLSGGTELVIIDEEEMPTTGNPHTGDSVFPLVMCGLALILGLALIAWYFKMTKDENKEVA